MFIKNCQDVIIWLAGNTKRASFGFGPPNSSQEKNISLSAISIVSGEVDHEFRKLQMAENSSCFGWIDLNIWVTLSTVRMKACRKTDHEVQYCQ